MDGQALRMQHFRRYDEPPDEEWPAEEPLARKYVVYIVDPEVDDNLDDYC